MLSWSSALFQFVLPAAWRAAFTWAGVELGLFALYSAAAPVTCGVAIDVPLIVLYPPPFQVDRMHTPGAMRSTSVPKFEKSANVSSWSARQVAAAPPPGAPLKSARADTVMTSA